MRRRWRAVHGRFLTPLATIALVALMHGRVLAADGDGDGVDDSVDNCPAVANPDQRDREGDGRGDVCDNCVDAFNGDQRDRDGDGTGDVCELWNDVVWVINSVNQVAYNACVGQCGLTTICFDRCGRSAERSYLYTSDFSGANLTELPGGGAHWVLWDPEVSPDGRRLAYFKGDSGEFGIFPGQVCVLDGTGTRCFPVPFNHSKRFSSDLTWSADSRVLYLALLDPMNLSSLRVDDPLAQREAAPTKGAMPVCNVAASSDGASLVLLRRSQCTQGLGTISSYELTSRAESVIYGSDSNGWPECEPIGDALVWQHYFSCAPFLFCADIYEGDRLKSVPVLRTPGTEWTLETMPRFSPDATEIFYTELVPPDSTMILHVVDRAGGERREVLPLGVNKVGSQSYGVSGYDVTHSFAGDDDGDGELYGQDNCPDVSNPAQEDRDGDRVGDACDCAPDDETLFVLPGEVPALRWSDDGELLWTRATTPRQNVVVHQVLRGRLDELPVTGRMSDVCLADALVGTSMIDEAAPPAGRGWWYLVRGRNGCGAGPYGHQSSGSQRTSHACLETEPTPVSGTAHSHQHGEDPGSE